MHINLDSLTLENESDVEQKLVMPLLTSEVYFDLPEAQIYTKDYVAPTVLDKKAGKSSHYVPDYTVWMQGFPGTSRTVK